MTMIMIELQKFLKVKVLTFEIFICRAFAQWCIYFAVEDRYVLYILTEVQ